jgi:hypothetical protein
MTGNLIPLSDEQAKLATKALEVLEGVGGFLREVLGDVPANLIGLLGGDWLRNRRAINLAEFAARTKERLKARGVQETRPASLSLAVPLLQAAADESRPEIQNLWARLMAAAMDPSRSSAVRQTYVETVKQMDPIDALVLEKLVDATNWAPNARDALAQMFKRSSDEIEVSFQHLTKLECIKMPGDSSHAVLTALGRELMRTVRD